jgi:dTDP-4-dehydrorhamnose reductase
VRYLITGASGQVGAELARQLPALGEVIALNRSALDLRDSDRIRHVIREVRPDVMVNAAAYTAVDRAESEPLLARQVNATAPRVMAEELSRIGAALVHYSTDYVFDGTKSGPYTEEDRPNPICAYGESKLEGELAVQQSGVMHLILRTSWIYGATGRNFLLTMVRAFAEQSRLSVVDDQMGAPTWSRWLAQATTQMLATAEPRRALAPTADAIVHVSAGSVTSWFGFACAISESYCARFGVRTPDIVPVPTAQRPAAARRPLNSVLSNARLSESFGVAQPSWESLLQQCMAELHLESRRAGAI